MLTLKITRRTKVGFGYSTSIKQTSAGYQIESPIAPYHVGTVNTVTKLIQDDLTYQSLRNGTFYSACWFIWHEHQWYKLEIENITELLVKYDNKYINQFLYGYIEK